MHDAEVLVMVYYELFLQQFIIKFSFIVLKLLIVPVVAAGERVLHYFFYKQD